jgi:hypothetical protein
MASIVAKASPVLEDTVKVLLDKDPERIVAVAQRIQGVKTKWRQEETQLQKQIHGAGCMPRLLLRVLCGCVRPWVHGA